MNRTCLGLLLVVCSIGRLFSAQMGTMNAPTFTKDVAPILQQLPDLPPARRSGSVLAAHL